MVEIAFRVLCGMTFGLGVIEFLRATFQETSADNIRWLQTSALLAWATSALLWIAQK